MWCARGGYGAARTVAALDDGALDEIAAGDPKVFMGFSDITVLYALVSRWLGWVSFYGPGVSKLGRANDYTLDGIRAALFAAAPFEVAARPDDDWVSTFVPGQADGVLAGGVLPRLAALVGTPLQVDFAGKRSVAWLAAHTLHEGEHRLQDFDRVMLQVVDVSPSP